MINRRTAMAGIAATGGMTLLGAGPGRAAGSGAKLNVVFINDGHTAPYHVAWLKGFDDAIAAYNKAFGNVSGHWLSAEGSLEKMVEQAQTTINARPTIMFVNAINTDAFVPLVKKAQDAGIIWVAVHSPMPSADYSFTLGDIENGYHQGTALGAYYNGRANVAIMLGQAGNPSGENRQKGILKGLAKYPNIKILAQQPADWNTIKAQSLAENWLTQFPQLDAISVVTDAYLYPAMSIYRNAGNSKVTFWGHDGDVPMLKRLAKPESRLKADVLLSGTREGWAFLQFAWKITHGIKVDKVYDFPTPLVLNNTVYEKVKRNGFPSDINVIDPASALDVATHGYKEFGPGSVK